VKLASRQLRADVAFGGAFYAIVDSEAVGLPIDVAHLPELRRVGMEIKHAIEAAQTIVHPLEPGCAGSTARSSPARRATSAPTCATSRSSRTPKSIDRRAAPARRR
jgi:proline racemase